MSYTRMNVERFMVLVVCASVLVGCGESEPATSEPLARVFCNNADAAAPSCSLAGFSVADDSAIRSKLEGCAVAGCHGAGAVTFSINLATASIEDSLTPLATQVGISGYPLVDQFYPDCSDMLTKLTDDWGAGQRMPLGGTPWSNAEIDCFRSYLNEIGN